MTAERRFAYRLSLYMGIPNPDVLLRAIPYRIYREWQEYASIEPFGENRADLRTGILAAVTANCHVRKQGQRAFQPRDFMPNFEQRKQAGPKEHLQAFTHLTRMMGGKIRVVKQSELDGYKD